MARSPLNAPSYVATGLSKTFDGARVLTDVSITFQPGEVHSVVGENGAGKSTLLKILAGIYQPDSGDLVLGGERLSGLSPRAAQHRGIYLVPQEPALMQSLSVTENLFVGILKRGWLRFMVDWAAMRRDAAAYLERVGLDIDPELKAEELSIAQQQLVECARALVHRCLVIYFDEPTSPLTSKEAGTLFEVMGRLRSDGYTLGFISHRLDEVLAISDRVTVLRDGAKVMSGPRSEVDRASLVRAMVGRDLVTRERVRPHFDAAERTTMLAVEDLTSRPSFEGISFSVRKGEILGLAGLVGSGRTEIAEAIFGIRPADRGTVKVAGKLLENRTPRACIDAGLVYLPEDRARHGIFAEVEVARNVPAVKAIIPIDSAAVPGTAEAISDLHDAGKIGDFGIGPPKESRSYFANGSLQALFLWDEIGQGKLDMLMARLAYEGAHGAPECTASTPPANPSPSQWCGIKTNYGKAQSFNGAVVGLPHVYTVAAAASKVTGATKNTVIYSTPLEFNKANYMKYNF